VSVRLLSTVAITIITLLISVSPVFAQGFSGSDINNYRCPIFVGLSDPIVQTGRSYCAQNTSPANILCDDGTGRYVCLYQDSRNGQVVVRDAALRPPHLRVIEVWFVRIIAVLWALSGLAFTGLLMWIGFKYMTSFNNQYVLGEVIKDFRKWLIGLALIFLSYPVLVTFFRLLPLSNSQCYQDIDLPGFQFFFPTVCQTRESYCGQRYLIDPPAPLNEEYSRCITGEID
jgi:hypothetical protein